MIALSRLLVAGILAAVVASQEEVSNALIELPANFDCPEPDGFFAHGGQCDKYFQCYEGVATEKICPDGLLFLAGRAYPCAYPVEVDCGLRSGLQDPQPTDDCPRQFSIARTSAEPAECGGFTNCVGGRAFYIGCPETLAFDKKTLLCQWADEVEDCDVSGFLNFTCPAQEFTPDQVGNFNMEAHPSDCTKFYLCLNKEDGTVQPRLRGCPEATVFDPVKKMCSETPEEVPGCEDAIEASVLATFRKRQQIEEERRETRLQELRESLTG